MNMDFSILFFSIEKLCRPPFHSIRGEMGKLMVKNFRFVFLRIFIVLLLYLLSPLERLCPQGCTACIKHSNGLRVFSAQDKILHAIPILPRLTLIWLTNCMKWISEKVINNDDTCYYSVIVMLFSG